MDDWRDVDGIPRGLPESHKFNDYDLKRKRLGFNGSVEIKPDDESLYYLRAVYSKFDEDETRYRNRNYFGERENNNTLTGSNVGIYDNQRIRNELRFEEKDKRISNYSIGGENTVDQYKFTYDANLIDNNTTEPNTSWAFRSGRIFSGTFDMGPELFEVRPNQAEVLSQLDLIPSEGVSFQDNNTDEDGYQAKGGVQYDFQADDYSGFVKTGVLYRSVERKQDLNGISYDDGPVGFNVGTPGITTGDTVEGTIQGQYYWAGAKLDLDGLRSFTDANLNNPDIFEFNAGDTLVDSTLGDFTVEEDVLSGYLMANVDIGDFEASIAYDWADDILVEVGGSADGDIYDLNYGRWDFKANYQITDNYGVFMEVQNINDAALGEYQGRTDYITRREIYGMTGYIGASFRF